VAIDRDVCELVSQRVAAEQVAGMSPRMFRDYVRAGRGPRPFDPTARRLTYSRTVVREWARDIATKAAA